MGIHDPIPGLRREVTGHGAFHSPGPFAAVGQASTTSVHIQDASRSQSSKKDNREVVWDGVEFGDRKSRARQSDTGSSPVHRSAALHTGRGRALHVASPGGASGFPPFPPRTRQAFGYIRRNRGKPEKMSAKKRRRLSTPLDAANQQTDEAFVTAYLETGCGRPLPSSTGRLPTSLRYRGRASWELTAPSS